MVDHLPPAANSPFLLHDVQFAEDCKIGLLAQEMDPSSLLRQALNRALDQSEAGLGIDHETVRFRYLSWSIQQAGQAGDSQESEISYKPSG